MLSTLIVLTLALVPITTAQFGFFDQIFGQQQQQQQQRPSGASQWHAHSESGMSSVC
jgi:hypothetical protein